MSDLETILGRALQHGEDGEWEEMAQTLADALEADYPDDPYLLCWLGVAERELGNEGAAYERFKQALATVALGELCLLSWIGVPRDSAADERPEAPVGDD